MTSASHGFRTSRSRGIASRSIAIDEATLWRCLCQAPNIAQAFDTTLLQQIEINFFQPMRLRGEVEIFSHRFASRMPNARKKTGILCGFEQRSR